MNQKC